MSQILVEPDRDTRKHFTEEVKAWERIMLGSAAVWGPMFLLGVFALSEFQRLATSRLIEHWVSNLMIPMYLYSLYLLLSVAVHTGDWLDYGLLFV